jgi:hypothetical protein
MKYVDSKSRWFCRYLKTSQSNTNDTQIIFPSNMIVNTYVEYVSNTIKISTT